MLFSTIEVVSKYLQAGHAGTRVGSMQVATVRFIFGALFLLPLLAMQNSRRQFVDALSKDSPRIALLGFVGVFLAFVLFHESIELTKASTAAVIFSMNPVITVLIARFALGERLKWVGWVGVLIGLLGSFIAITGFRFSGLLGKKDFLGGLLMFASAICWSSYTVYGKKYSERYGGLLVSLLSISVGAILFSLLLTLQRGWSQMAYYSVGTWLWLLYLGAVCVSLGYALYFVGLRLVPASRGASIFYVKPILAVIFARILLGETISLTVLLASFLVAAGILLVTLFGGAVDQRG